MGIGLRLVPRLAVQLNCTLCGKSLTGEARREAMQEYALFGAVAKSYEFCPKCHNSIPHPDCDDPKWQRKVDRYIRNNQK